MSIITISTVFVLIKLRKSTSVFICLADAESLFNNPTEINVNNNVAKIAAS